MIYGYFSFLIIAELSVAACTPYMQYILYLQLTICYNANGNLVGLEKCSMSTYDYEYTEFLTFPNIRLFVIDLVNSHVHMHKELELCYILSGEAEVLTGRQEKYHCVNGDMILLNSRQVHEIYAVNCKCVKILTLQISPAFCLHFFPEIDNVSFDNAIVNKCLSRDQMEQLQALLYKLAQHYFKMGQYSPFYCESSACLILSLLLENIPWHHISEMEKINLNITGYRIDRIVNYIEKNYTEKILLKDIADQEKLSLDYLSHFFRKHLHLSFQEYVSKLRFEKARLLLLKTDMSLTSICISSGFTDCRQMRKVFKSLANCEPEDYRKGFPAESGMYNTRPLNSIETELEETEALITLREHFEGNGH